jgi:hypothetical protein
MQHVIYAYTEDQDVAIPTSGATTLGRALNQKTLAVIVAAPEPVPCAIRRDREMCTLFTFTLEVRCWETDIKFGLWPFALCPTPQP